MPVISRGVPVYTSSAVYPATNANDADYSTYWRGTPPAWLAYDLSSVPAMRRGQVVVAWYNDPITAPYNHTVINDVGYNIPGVYSIEANAAAGGGAPPTAGWVTLASVTGNTYHSRQHVVNLTGYNWVRLNVTASDGSALNTDAMINMDVHDASQGVQDDWIFYGDSITQGAMAHQATGSYSQLINAAQPGRFPAAEDGGIGYLLSADGASHLDTWLPLFPGHYVGLAFGTNDANGCVSP